MWVFTCGPIRETLWSDLHTCSVGARWTDPSVVKIWLQDFVEDLFLLFSDVGLGLRSLSRTARTTDRETEKRAKENIYNKD